MKFKGILIALAALIFLAGLIFLVRNGKGGGGAGLQSQVLRVGFDEAPRSSDPRLLGFDANSQYLEELRFLPLVSFHEDGSIRYILAQSVEAHTPTSFQVTLRSGLKFSNGMPITAQDVVATYRHILSPPEGFPPSPRRGAFSRVTEVKETGPLGLSFELGEPDAAFPTNLVIGILPASALSDPPEELIGKGYESGPYLLTEKSDSEWVIERNPNFDGVSFGMVSPLVARVEFLIVKDETTRYAALVRGDLDILQNALDADKVVALQKNKDFNIVTRTKMSIDYLGIAASEGPLTNPLVRKAIAHGINREEILKFTLQGLGEKATGMFPPEFPWHIDLPSLDYDPELSKRLLDEANYPVMPGANQRFQFSLKITTSKTRVAIAKAIAAQLADVGIGVDVESLEFGVFMDQLKEGAVSAWLASWTGFKDPDHLHFVFHSAMIPPLGGNRGRYVRPEVDTLLASGKSESDPAKRTTAYTQAQKLLADDLPYIYLWHPSSYAVIRSNIKGFRMYSDGRYLSLPDVTKD